MSMDINLNFCVIDGRLERHIHSAHKNKIVKDDNVEVTECAACGGGKL